MNGSDEYERKRTGAEQALHRGKVVTSLVRGTQRLLDSIHESRAFEFRLTRTPNDPFGVAQNDRMVAINGALPMERRAKGAPVLWSKRRRAHWHRGAGG